MCASVEYIESMNEREAKNTQQSFTKHIVFSVFDFGFLLKNFTFNSVVFYQMANAYLHSMAIENGKNEMN